MSILNFLLSRVEHKSFFITSGPVCLCNAVMHSTDAKRMANRVDLDQTAFQLLKSSLV